MSKTILIALLLMTVPAFVSAEGACPPAGESVLVDAGSTYVTGDLHIYQESNGLAGLQRTAGSCEDENGRTRVWLADTLVA